MVPASGDGREAAGSPPGARGVAWMERWVEEAQDDVAELVVLSLLAGEVQTPEIDGGGGG